MIINRIFGTLTCWFNQCRLNICDQLGEVQGQQIVCYRSRQLPCTGSGTLKRSWKMSSTKCAPQKLSSSTIWLSTRHEINSNSTYTSSSGPCKQPIYNAYPWTYWTAHNSQDLFEAGTSKDKAHQHQLLIHHPSDLLQIVTSYLHDGQDVQLILQIPMAPIDSVLWLFQLHPFLLAFTDTHFLMPDLTNQILAISSSTEHLSLEMSAINLMGCHCINSV